MIGMIKVVKRNGATVEFDKNKIANAINKAVTEVYGVENISKPNTQGVVYRITEHILNDYLQKITVEDIQDIVERELMDFDKEVAKAYITYRYKRSLARNEYETLMKEVKEKISANNVQNQNANVDEYSFGGRIGETADMIMKRYALEYCMSDLSKNNHLNNEIYIHDLSHYPVGNHNCLSVPFDDLLANGFNTRQTDVRPAQSVSTAFQLVAVIFQLQSLQQFGGVSATHLDWTMVPYVRKSFAKHFKDGVRYILKDSEYAETIPTELSYNDKEANYEHNKEAYEYAYDMTKKEIYQAVEGLYHNLNTLQSRSGNQLN